jgi:branched-chain amino acid transport system ATP-binding protein
MTFRVDQGEMVTLLGANGAGKSTTLKTISALLRARSGTIELEGERLNALPPHEIVRRGIAHVPEGRRVFPRLSVLENLQTGAYSQSGGASADDLERVFGLFPRLKERIRQKAGTLSGGEQQMLAIGRGLMARPKMLLLDEPSMGLAPILVEQIFAIVQAINKEGVTVLLVEQNAAMALAICHRGYVLETGKIILEGTAAELSGNDRVREAYLGG